jgi:hypothetical protein
VRGEHQTSPRRIAFWSALEASYWLHRHPPKESRAIGAALTSESHPMAHLKLYLIIYFFQCKPVISHASLRNSVRSGTSAPKIEYLRFTLAFATLLLCGSIDERIQRSANYILRKALIGINKYQPVTGARLRLLFK